MAELMVDEFWIKFHLYISAIQRMEFICTVHDPVPGHTKCFGQYWRVARYPHSWSYVDFDQWYYHYLQLVVFQIYGLWTPLFYGLPFLSFINTLWYRWYLSHFHTYCVNWGMSILSYYIGLLLTLCTLIDFCLLLGTYINQSFSHLLCWLRLLSSIRLWALSPLDWTQIHDTYWLPNLMLSWHL